MTSVGEVMAIGRNFEEAIQKAVRMISGGNLEGLDGISTMPEGAELDELIRVPTDRRLFAVQTALERGYTIEEVGAAPSFAFFFFFFHITPHYMHRNDTIYLHIIYFFLDSLHYTASCHVRSCDVTTM